MDKVSFPYRSSSHLVFLHVVQESGAWAKHGLDVNYDFAISKTDAHRAMDAGEVEFIGGNHISTYAHRARGDDWVYLGQTANLYNISLCVRKDSGINSVADLRHKKLGSSGAHPGLNDWLYLKQHGLDVDKDEIEIVREVAGYISENAQLDFDKAQDKDNRKRSPTWHWVRDGHVDGVFITPPSTLFAEAAGLKIIEIEAMPMIWFTTISSNQRFVQRHPNLVERFLKGVVEGVHFFKTEREKSIEIIQRRYTKVGQMTKDQATFTWESVQATLDPRLYPSMPAIMNVYEEAKRQDKDAAKVNPLSLWDMHHIRRIDDTGFVDGLYQKKHAWDQKHTHDLDYQKEKKQEAARVVASVKACGHLSSFSCDCE